MGGWYVNVRPTARRFIPLAPGLAIARWGSAGGLFGGWRSRKRRAGWAHHRRGMGGFAWDSIGI